MKLLSFSADHRRPLLAGLLGCILLVGCGGSDEGNSTVEVDMGDTNETIDLDAYAEQRLNGGAVTLIDAALPDGTLMPASHSGPTLGEIQEAEKAKARAEAEKAQAEADVRSSVADDSGSVAESTPVLEIDPSVVQ